MKKSFNTISLAAAAAVCLGAATGAEAAVVYATEVTSYVEGSGITDPGRRVTDNALGAADGTFLSLGLAGEAIFSFGTSFGSPGAVFEITNGIRSTYLETAKVFGWDGADWQPIGSITNAGTSSSFTFSGVFSLLKIVDTSPAFAGRDGFDIDAVSVAAVPLPAAGFLMIAALGGLAAARRRKAA